ncbi:MAG: hypothetical protein EON93_07560 [Burkholderiales bacterium]|nr:MAG: hypothetical protein EON93_07560 [Burkholderiales bacterium]
MPKPSVIMVCGAAIAVAVGVSSLFIVWNGPGRTSLAAMWADRTLGKLEKSGADLLAHREETKAAILESLGDGPPVSASGEMSTRKIDDPTELPVEEVSFIGADNDSLTALIGYPTDRPTPRGIVIALHQTTDIGMREPMGLAGKSDLAFGALLQGAGYMVVAPEVFTTGERAGPGARWLTNEFYQRYPAWSAMGKMLADNETAVSVAMEAYRKRYGAEPVCIAAVGHSLGAHNALLLAAFDKRIDAVVANAGFERIASDTDAIRWSRDDGFIYMPALAAATRGKAPLTWDWEDVLIQIFPRSQMIIQGLEDPIFTNEISVAQASRSVEEAYRDEGHADRFESHLWAGGHAFPMRFQGALPDWIDHACKVQRGSAG